MATSFSLVELSESLADLARDIRNSVVQVHAGRHGIGSGIIWRVSDSPEGSARKAIVITNAHVALAARGQPLATKLADGRLLDATVIDRDSRHDLAALRIHGTDLRPARMGDSRSLRVGEVVVALGNPWGHEGAVTAGVIASAHPPEENSSDPAGPRHQPDWGFGWNMPLSERHDLIVADIRLYPGNSGGPLVDARGRVVGVNTMVGGGLGFALPHHVVEAFVSGLERERLYLGLQITTVPIPALIRARLGIAQPSAALVLGVEENGPADAAGLQLGDVLLAVDGVDLLNAERLPHLLNEDAPGSARTLTLLRGGRQTAITLIPMPRAAA